MNSLLMTAGRCLATQARLRPNATGAKDLERSLSFREWNERSDRLANALIGLGLSKGDRVAVLAYNRLEWAEIYIATAKAGLVAVPINFRLTAREAGYIISDSGARALLVEDALIGLVEELGDDLDLASDRVVLIGGAARAGYADYEALIGEASNKTSDIAVSPEDIWCLLYTSGTTGNPKGAIRRHRSMTMVALMTAVEFRLHTRDDALLVMPLCHGNSLYFLMSCLFAGAAFTIFSRRSFDPELCLRALGQGATFSSLVPTHYAMMLDTPRQSAIASVEKLLVSSATAFPEMKRQIIEMFPNSGLYELYGSTESSWATILHPDEQFEHLGTVGREVIGSAPIRLLNDDGEEVPDGQPGELFSSSPYQFDGYWNLPEKTAEAFRGDYLSVGDIALRDEHGYIRLIDRKKNLIVSGGENIYPTEVEQVLSQHETVSEVAAIGLPDPKWSERVVACVALVNGAEPDANKLLAWSRERLAGFKRPREIFFLDPDQFPRTATGKIQHRRLREQLEKQQR